MTKDVILKRMAAEIKQNNLVLFVGAGMSAGAGLPGWADLIGPLAVDIGRAVPVPGPGFGEQLLEIAAEFEASHGRNALVRHLRQELAGPLPLPTTTHEYLPRLLPRGVLVTTNYDELIERAYFNATVPAQTMISDSDLPYWNGAGAQLIKLRGDINRPEGLVVTRRDYDNHPLKQPVLHQQLTAILATRTALFVGYSHSDPDTTMLLHRLQHQLGVHMRTWYTVQFDISTTAAQAWSRSHQGVLPFVLSSSGSTRTDALCSFLSDLHDEVKKGP
ncbi:SIR2 family protein [Asanoa sp. NPDC049573]|uniref:SIR2 family protein n=1 Tax=Asanoa sp. NPDC049573 TaxID=3155396 RepID=UPI0034247236